MRQDLSSWHAQDAQGMLLTPQTCSCYHHNNHSCLKRQTIGEGAIWSSRGCLQAALLGLLGADCVTDLVHRPLDEEVWQGVKPARHVPAITT